jgi:plasmid maintenance system killer protein
MIKVDFSKNKELEKLYTTGKGKKYNKLDVIVKKKYVMRINTFKASNSIYDFWKLPSLNFEGLEGYGNKYSVRINKKYRLEFVVDWSNQKQTEGTFYITEISKHYGD